MIGIAAMATQLTASHGRKPNGSVEPSVSSIGYGTNGGRVNKYRRPPNKKIVAKLPRKVG
jgi:hypothetical protein